MVRPISELKAVLDGLYADFDRDTLVVDPVRFVHRYRDPADREVVAFCAAGLAFGRVAAVLNSVDSLLALMGSRPARYIRRFDPKTDGRALQGLGHRWTKGVDLVALLWVLHQALRQSGSLEAFFLEGYDSGMADLGPALESWSGRVRRFDLTAAYGRRLPNRPGVWYFFPRPSDGSGCKRLNLFLRWMVRQDGIDPGGWTGVPAAKLIVPLDTHVIRVGRCLGLTRYRSPGWRMAAEITESLKAIDPADPVKYDFALCHIGMLGLCDGTERNTSCPLRPFCGRPATAGDSNERPPDVPARRGAGRIHFRSRRPYAPR